MRSPAMHLSLRVRNCIRATPRSTIIKLALDEASFEFRAGQAALLGLQGQPLRRPYSIASAPSDVQSTGVLEFLVQDGTHGSLGPHLAGVTRGSTVVVEGPFGNFALSRNPPAYHYLFVAGGSGIAPLRSMMRHVLDHSSRAQISVAYSARTSRDWAYAAELRQLARRGAIRLILTTTRDARPGGRAHHGRLTAEDFRGVGASADTRSYICGPESLVSDAAVMLVQAGLEPEHIHRERW